MTRNEALRIRRQMHRRIREVVADRRMAINQRSTGDSGPTILESQAVGAQRGEDSDPS